MDEIKKKRKKPKPHEADCACMRCNQHKWKELPFEKWNTNTFFAYLLDRHREVRSIDYVAGRGKQVDLRMIKDFVNTHGKEITRAFIDECLKQYKVTNTRYMICTFTFMRTYMAAQILPQLQVQAQRAEEAAKETDYEEIVW